LDRFTDEGGRALFTRPATEMKCAGAPLKYAFLTDDHARRKGTRGRIEITYAAHGDSLFSVPIVNEKVRMLFEDRGIATVHDHVLTAIDPGRKVATFASPEGETELPFDFTNVIPPMQVPGVEDHLVAEIAGGEGTATYNGYTSCPLITRVGRAMLVEFDYHNNLVPSFPGLIAPLEELWVSWLMKEVALKATYNAMLRGKA
jgi:NADPH-dependent 2,4-dienoyl-CoA reductase/sulfur reductase-like enzyme